MSAIPPSPSDTGGTHVAEFLRARPSGARS
jgi:hypothetical protein